MFSKGMACLLLDNVPVVDLCTFDREPIGLVESKLETKLDVALWEDLKIDMEVSNLCLTESDAI